MILLHILMGFGLIGLFVYLVFPYRRKEEEHVHRHLTLEEAVGHYESPQKPVQRRKRKALRDRTNVK